MEDNYISGEEHKAKIQQRAKTQPNPKLKRWTIFASLTAVLVAGAFWAGMLYQQSIATQQTSPSSMPPGGDMKFGGESVTCQTDKCPGPQTFSNGQPPQLR
jgi:hypothetical protein